MKGVNPKLLLALVGIVVFAAYLKLSNPYKKYSRQVFWQTATVEDVYSIPEEVLLPGNRNGAVLMWAATGTSDPQVIRTLVERGADVNEPDTTVFSGTPLSAAAGFATNPAIVDELVRLGADVNMPVGTKNKSPLIIAAELNHDPEIARALIRHGADTSYQDDDGKTALDRAMQFGNTAVVTILKNAAK